MPNPLSDLSKLPLLPMAPPSLETIGSEQSGGSSIFQSLLMNSLEQTAGLERSAETAIQQSLTGEHLTMVEGVMAVREADLALRMMLQVRNKVLDAYNEIKEMRI